MRSGSWSYLIALLLGARAVLGAMDAPPPAGPESLAQGVGRMEDELGEVQGLVREARLNLAALLEAGPVPGGWTGSARWEAERLKAEGHLRMCEAEAALAEADRLEALGRMLERRPPGRRELQVLALLGLCWERSQKAEGTAILAVQEARALAAKAAVRQALAEAMASCGDGRERPDPKAFTAACNGVLDALEEAEDTVGVPLTFLRDQEADLDRVLKLLVERAR